MTITGFLDVHVIHAVPFSNLNRDNLGTPKQMVFGGTTRARISSQCTKRAARLWLEDSNNTNFDKALRTRRLPQMVFGELTARHGFTGDEARQATIAVFALAGIKVEDATAGDGGQTLQGDQLTFTTRETAADLAATAAEHRSDILADDFKPKKAVKEQLLAPLSAANAVIALCGRMLASLPGSNVDGALQVAHAFTTHTSTLELDYFTAVDDEVQDSDTETGAGHINVNEFTAGVFYRHATIGLHQLRDSLDGSEAATAEVAASFVRAFALAEPTGKQNTANAHTRPALVAVTLRTDRPVSFAAAFEKPVALSRDGGHTANSIARLTEHAAAENGFYGTAGLAAAWYAANSAAVPDDAPGLGHRCANFDALTTAIEAAMNGEPS